MGASEEHVESLANFGEFVVGETPKLSGGAVYLGLQGTGGQRTCSIKPATVLMRSYLVRIS